MTWVKLLCSLT